MAYNKNVDYRELIDKAAAAGNYREAARLEQQRNEKIRGEGMSYGTTSEYSGWLDDNDYGEQIKQTISAGGSKDKVASLLSDRVSKAANTKGMEQWAADDIYDMAVEYLSTPSKGSGYQSSYSDRIDKLLDKLLEREAFSYDYESDPLYQAYAKVYQREGRRASEDAIGLTSQNTGGYASSYSSGAAQQARSYYGAQQADKIPELYKLAYEIYKDDFEADLESMGILTQLDENEYQRYRDRLDEAYRQDELEFEKYIKQLGYDLDREQAGYDRYRDQLEDERYETEWLYQLERDRIADERYNAKLAAAGAGSASSGSSRGSSGSGSAGRSSKAASGADDDLYGEELYDETPPASHMVRVYGLNGSFTWAEAEEMVKAGLADRIGIGVYKLAAVS